MAERSAQPKPEANAIPPRAEGKAGKALVIENLPEVSRRGLKVVQVELDGKDYLVFQGEGEALHVVIFRNFLKRHDVELPDQNPNDPKREGERYKLVGAGSVDVAIPADGGKKRLDFRSSASSFHYEINLDYERLDGLQSELKDWEIKLKWGV